MALLTVDELVEAIVGLNVDDTTQPSTDDVTEFIAEIEGEVRSLWIGCGGTWPTTVDDASESLILTIRLGAEWRTLAALYSFASGAMTPDSVAQARLAYNDRLNRLCSFVAGEEQPTVAHGPLVGVAADTLYQGSSFREWTQSRDLRQWPVPWRLRSW